MKLVEVDPELRAVNETLLCEYAEHLVDPASAKAMLRRLKAQVLNNRPSGKRREYLTGPKFERAILGVIDAQAGIAELKTFPYRSLSGEARIMPRIDLLWLKQYYRFSNDVIAQHLKCNVRHVARMATALKALGLRFKHPRSINRRPDSFAPLPKKPRFTRSLTPEEYAWVEDVRNGKAVIRLNGRERTGPDAAKELKYLLYRDKYNEQYHDWVYEKRTRQQTKGKEG